MSVCICLCVCVCASVTYWRLFNTGVESTAAGVDKETPGWSQVCFVVCRWCVCVGGEEGVGVGGVCVFVCVCEYVFACVRLSVCACVRMYVNVCVCVRACVRACVHVCVRA